MSNEYGTDYGFDNHSRARESGEWVAPETGSAAVRAAPDGDRDVSDGATDGETAERDLVELVRAKVEDRAHAELVGVREATASHVEIVLAEGEAESQRSHYLYWVTVEPDIDSGTHLHWKSLGEVVED